MAKTILLLSILLIYSTFSLTVTERTPDSVTKSFRKYDKDNDGLLVKNEVKEFFDKQYMKDFEGIDIDVKFIDSTFNYILSSDKNGNGIQIEEFIDVIVPKKDSAKKREPDYYPEQEL